MPVTHVRVPGGGNTYIMMGLSGGKMVEFLSDFQDTAGRPNGNATEIQPIGHKYPVEIATPYSQKAGTLTLNVWETWGKDGWVSAFMYDTGQNAYNIGDSNYPWKDYVSPTSGVERLPVDLYEVLDAQRKLTEYITVKKVELGASGQPVRIKTYVNAVIVDIQDNELVDQTTMEKKCTITIMYTNKITTVAEQEGGTVTV